MDFTQPPKQCSQKHLRKYVKSLLFTFLKAMLLPFDICSDFDIDIAEVKCTNPKCRIVEPHTFVSIFFTNGGFGKFAIPLSLPQIDTNACSHYLPTHEVMSLWSQGVKVEWPLRHNLRFELDTMVQCKIKSRGKQQWAYGRISALYYSEKDWSPLYVAPYQIKLFDGTSVYAQQDSDDLVKSADVRFAVGDRVNVFHINIRSRSCGIEKWSYGRIVRLLYYEEEWAPECVAPYQVMLHTGELIYVPEDCDEYIQLRPDPADDAPSSPPICYDYFKQHLGTLL